MYAQVVVLTYQPPSIPTYTYKIPKEQKLEIKAGQLVSVPFGKRSPMGIIISLNTQPHVIPAKAGIHSKKDWIPDQVGDDRKKTQIKPINSIIFPTPILLPYQIKLLEWMAFYYHAPMVNCLEAMIPRIPMGLPNSQIHLRGIPPEARLAKGGKAYLGGETLKQTLVLVPSINNIPETLAKYPQAKKFVVYHNELKTSEKFTTWLKISSGNVDFIFGSRSTIFAPCPNLSKIVIYDEHDPAFKDERSPYFDTLTIAEKISVFSGCKIQIFDSSPKVTTYFNHSVHLRGVPPEARLAKGGKAHLGGEESKKPPRVKIVNMLDEKKAGNYLPISDLLAKYLKIAVKKQKNALLFLNKKVETGHFYCRSCQYQEFVNKQPETCPKCQSSDIRFNSLNINSLASLIQKIIPSAKINIVASNNAHPRGVKTHPGGVLSTEAIDIATASVFYRLTPERYDLVAHIRTDSTLAIADIAANERAYAQITNLKKLARGILFLQTYNPDNFVIQSAASGNYQQFYKNQLTERKALSYPPFSILVKLSLRGKKEESIKQNAQKLFDELNQLPGTRNWFQNSLFFERKQEEQALLFFERSANWRRIEKFDSSLRQLTDRTISFETGTSYHVPVTILGPYKPLFEKKIHKYNIILKMPITSYNLSKREQALKILKTYLNGLPRSVQITVEPNSLN